MNQFQNYNPAPYTPQQLQQEYQRQYYFKLKRDNEKREIIKTGVVIGATILFYLIIQSILVLILQSSDYYSLYSSSSLFQNTFNIIAVDICSLVIPFFIMSLILKKRYTGDLIPRESFGKLPSFAFICLGMGGCILANYITAFVIELFKVFGYELTQSQYNDPNSAIECIAIVFSTAIAPAICEEFAMRCCTLGALRKYGKGFAVVAVSIVFGLIHGNVIQFVFAFLVGLILGYITVVTDNVIPAMFVHGFNNGISVINDIIKYAFGSDATEYAGVVCYIIWIPLAIWGLSYLTLKKKLLPKKEQKIKEPYALSFGSKLLCMLPGLFIPLCILIYLTTQTIVPIQ